MAPGDHHFRCVAEIVFILRTPDCENTKVLSVPSCEFRESLAAASAEIEPLLVALSLYNPLLWKWPRQWGRQQQAQLLACGTFPKHQTPVAVGNKALLCPLAHVILRNPKVFFTLL